MLNNKLPVDKCVISYFNVFRIASLLVKAVNFSDTTRSTLVRLSNDSNKKLAKIKYRFLSSSTEHILFLCYVIYCNRFSIAPDGD